ncbi:SET domain-containing protein 4-like [Mercenaria mercenaria]|uniref:SET domain-containing protein 4-like n=1 Tax=Mercenaria mercenaria TaxID=6596 RepID=UPI00234F8337|nr:SET domain-containing protein 4-like [Mercenaria mercenaria]
MERNAYNARLGRRNREKRRRVKCVSNSFMKSCAHEEGFVKLRQWMTQNYGFRNCLVPALFPETGRGLMTKRAIKSGEIIVSLPHSLLITTKTVLDSEIGHVIKRWKPKLSPQQCLSIFLIWERNKHTSSTWFPYINLLPSSFTTPAYFSQTELTYLPTAVRSKAVKECEKLEDTFNEVKQFSMKHWNEFYKMLTSDVYRWAWYVINTRSVFYQSGQSEYLSTEEPDTIALAPFLDLLNHSPAANIKAGFNPVNKSYEIITNDTYKAYDQVFISYGCHGNQKLFLEYGFCVPDNPDDEFEVMLYNLVILLFFSEDIVKACKHFAVEHLSKKMELLQEHGLLKSLMCTKEGLSWKLLTVFKTLAMDWNQLQCWNQVFTDEAAFTEVLPAANNMASYILQQYLTENTQLMKYVEQTVSSTDNPEHVDIARQLIYIEKHILTASLPS